MRTIKKIQKLFRTSVVFLFLMSASILIMPFSVEAKTKGLLYANGLMFWVSCVIGYCVLIAANRKRKSYIKHSPKGKTLKEGKVGFFAFFSNLPALVADITMIVSFLLFVVISFTEWKYEYISYVVLFVFVFSLNLHGLFNGRIYKIVKNKGEKK